MIKLTDIIYSTPGIEYHLKHGLALHENVYRYSSEAFIGLFAEARKLYESKQIDLIPADVELISETDIGEYGVFEGSKVPLDLPMFNEAEYQGKKVKLNDPIRGGSKKFYVYTKNEKGNIVKVSFGDTTGLSIKRDDPARRRSFRARHNCDNPGPKWKARYWSCYQWRAGAKVNN